MLHARDVRQSRQRELAALWPEATTVVLTVVAPGAEKRNRNTLAVAQAACKALRRDFAEDALLWEEKDLPTGFELWIVTPLPATDAKRIACAIENSHPLGRLMDIDVIGRDLRPMPRSAVGLPERGCLVCGDNARICMRAARHSYEEILARITEMVDKYGGQL